MLKKKFKLLLEIYIAFFKLGSISFGGGYSMIPLIEREVVEDKKWVDKQKIIDIFAVSESLPGAIGLNSSAFVGYSVAGIPGAIFALLGNLTPSVIIVLTLSVVFMKFNNNPSVKSAFRGIYPAIVGLVAYASYKMGKTALEDKACIGIMIVTFCCSMFLQIDPIPLIVSGAIAGVVISSVKMIIKARRNSGVIMQEKEKNF